MSTTQQKQGFTIIEVVLVLAIAGLIFLMVFIALPALQRGQRDTARKSDASIALSAVTAYKSNNRGTFPTATALGTYMTDKSENTTTVTVGTAPTADNQSYTVTDGTVTVVQSAKCDTTAAGTVTLDRGTNAQFVAITYLENGGTGYCGQS